MERSTEFIVATIIIDVLLLGVLEFVPPVGDRRLYAITAVLLVSPALAYLVVYRWDLRGPSEEGP